MKSESNKKVRKIAQAALIVALSYVAFQFIKIPVSETTSLHIGNAFVVLGALLLGGLWGGIAGALGLTLADLTSGYVTTAPKTFILKLIIGLVAGLIAYKFMHIKDKSNMKDQYKIAIVASTVSLGLNCILDPVLGYFYKMYVLGIPQVAAEALAKISSFATLANAVVSALIVVIIWPPLYKALRKADMLVW